MPIWSEILAELKQSGSPDQPIDFDGVRRGSCAALHSHSPERNVILYASGWLQKPETGNESAISDEDIQGLMEVCYQLQGRNLDLILHSPGGSAEAAEAIVLYLRDRFEHIRVIVPQLAMSAATMIACAADIILMGNHSFLGPTDPQLWLATPLGVRFVPALALLRQFDRSQQECQDPSKAAPIRS